MKSIKLTGEALSIARQIVSVMDHHNAVHKAWEEKIDREHNQLAKASSEAMSEQLDLLVKALGLPGITPENQPQLDVRYVKDHGVAFLILADDNDEEPATAPGEH